MSKTKEIILLNISGEDKPGLTASLTRILSQYSVNILDIGQAVIHDDLGLGILFEVPKKSESAPILKDLLFRSYELGLNIKFTPITEKKYDEWVSHQGKERFIVTLLSRKLAADQLSMVTEVISEQGLNIDYITRLSGRALLGNEHESDKSVV